MGWWPMTKLLTGPEIASYHENGFYFPVRVLTPDKAAYYRDQFFATERRVGGAIKGAYAQKSNLIFRWVDELVHEPLLLDVVEDLIGSNILLWSTEFFVKAPKDQKYVSWHQDDTYWHLEPPIEITAWIALSDVPLESGPVRFIPKSHKVDRYRIINKPNANNMLQSGQIAQDVDETKAVDAILRAGEASLHHTKTLHASSPNTSDKPRLGIAARFIPTHVKQLHGRESAMLVRGADSFGHYDLEPRPIADLDAAARAAHKDAVLRHMANLQGSGYQAKVQFDEAGA
jgi:chlorinating enzyme